MYMKSAFFLHVYCVNPLPVFSVFHSHSTHLCTALACAEKHNDLGGG